MNRYDAAAARPLFQHAIELDPNYAQAYAWQAVSYIIVYFADGQPATLEEALRLADKAMLLACDYGRAREWLEAAGQRAGSSREAWFVRLASFLPLPLPGKELRLEEMLVFLERELITGEFAATANWLLNCGFPAFLAFSSPVAHRGDAIYAVQVPRPEVTGFRAGKVPNTVLLAPKQANGGTGGEAVSKRRRDTSR